MDLLRQTLNSFNPNVKTEQVNIPNGSIAQFTDACDVHKVTYTLIEQREQTTRYEIEYTGSQAFWLGVTFKDLVNSELYENGK